MPNNRDDFSKRTVEIVAKRVAYFCSNPNCRVQTTAPHTDPEKSSSIGVGAHITAAAPYGPRYDDSLTPLERKSALNCIYLCASCSVLIDKDPQRFPTPLLQQWKAGAEREARNAQGRQKNTDPTKYRPVLDVDIVWMSGGRFHEAWSQKNLELEDGVHSWTSLIVHWSLHWDFRIAIFNNSSFLAKNLQIVQHGKAKFLGDLKMDQVNNLPPFASIDREVRYKRPFEGTGMEADAILRGKIPPDFQGWQLELIYQDESGHQHRSLTEIIDGKVNTKKID